jgi:hypothetical protein
MESLVMQKTSVSNTVTKRHENGDKRKDKKQSYNENSSVEKGEDDWGKKDCHKKSHNMP